MVAAREGVVAALCHRSQDQRRTRQNRLETASAICEGVSRKREVSRETARIPVDISKTVWYVALLERRELAAEIRYQQEK